MRKVFFIGVILVTFIIFLLLVSFGFKLGPIKLMSYDEIDSLNINKKILLSELNNKSTVEYANKEKELKEKSDNYKIVKAEYDRLVNRGIIKEDLLDEYIDIYDFDEIWKSVQKYAKEKSVLVDVEIEKNNEKVSISPKYKVYDLKFSLVGDYINITDFIYSIEDDDSLGFTISNFEMKNGENGLEASFSVKDIPINVESLNK